MVDFLQWAHDNGGTLADIGMGATALYMVRQLTVAVKALTAAVAELKAGHSDHEGRLRALEAPEKP